MAAGAISADYGVPGVREHAFALKFVDDAVRLRRSLLDRFELAAAAPVRPDQVSSTWSCAAAAPPAWRWPAR